MRTPLDALLSVQKYAAEVLGDAWEVRLWQDRGYVKEGEPLAIVLKVGDTASVGSAHYADVTQPMAIHCYPAPKETVEKSIIQASRLEDVLQRGFRLQGVGLGAPLRVPLYDYDAIEDPLTVDSNDRVYADYLRLSNFTTGQLPDGEDPRRIRVIAQFSAGWRRTGQVPSGTHVVETVTSEFTVS